MILLLVSCSLLSDYLPDWLIALIFFGTFLFVILPINFGFGPLGRRLGKELNDAAIAEDKEYRKSLGPQNSNRETKPPTD